MMLAYELVRVKTHPTTDREHHAAEVNHLVMQLATIKRTFDYWTPEARSWSQAARPLVQRIRFLDGIEHKLRMITNPNKEMLWVPESMEAVLRYPEVAREILQGNFANDSVPERQQVKETRSMFDAYVKHLEQMGRYRSQKDSLMARCFVQASISIGVLDYGNDAEEKLSDLREKLSHVDADTLGRAMNGVVELKKQALANVRRTLWLMNSIYDTMARRLWRDLLIPHDIRHLRQVIQACGYMYQSVNPDAEHYTFDEETMRPYYGLLHKARKFMVQAKEGQRWKETIESTTKPLNPNIEEEWGDFFLDGVIPLAMKAGAKIISSYAVILNLKEVNPLSVRIEGAYDDQKEKPSAPEPRPVHPGGSPAQLQHGERGPAHLHAAGVRRPRRVPGAAPPDGIHTQHLEDLQGREPPAREGARGPARRRPLAHPSQHMGPRPATPVHRQHPLRVRATGQQAPHCRRGLPHAGQDHARLHPAGPRQRAQGDQRDPPLQHREGPDPGGLGGPRAPQHQRPAVGGQDHGLAEHEPGAGGPGGRPAQPAHHEEDEEEPQAREARGVQPVPPDPGAAGPEARTAAAGGRPQRQGQHTHPEAGPRGGEESDRDGVDAADPARGGAPKPAHADPGAGERDQGRHAREQRDAPLPLPGLHARAGGCGPGPHGPQEDVRALQRAGPQRGPRPVVRAGGGHPRGRPPRRPGAQPGVPLPLRDALLLPPDAGDGGRALPGDHGGRRHAQEPRRPEGLRALRRRRHQAVARHADLDEGGPGQGDPAGPDQLPRRLGLGEAARLRAHRAGLRQHHAEGGRHGQEGARQERLRRRGADQVHELHAQEHHGGEPALPLQPAGPQDQHHQHHHRPRAPHDGRGRRAARPRHRRQRRERAPAAGSVSALSEYEREWYIWYAPSLT
eukprot:438128-Hanusia_phi.AAC.4